MSWIIRTALRFRTLTVAAAAILVVLGIRAALETPFDVFPEFAPVLAEVQTEAPGLATEEVERLVTIPIENALNGVSWLDTIRSRTVLGLSSVVLIFEDGTDLMAARQMVQERLGTVADRLPSVARPPIILPPLSATSRIMKIGLTSKTLSQLDLSSLARWTIRPRLNAIPGVANVAIWGEQVRQIQALVDPVRLRANEVSLAQVVGAAQEALYIGAGGFVDTPNQRLAIFHTQAIESPQDLAEVPLALRGGGVLTIGDVAEVVEGHAQMIGDAVINDGPGLLLIVEKQPWGNTFEVTERVENALESMRPGLGDVTIDSTIFRPATFIEMSLRNLQIALITGCVLVIAILIPFLYEWRTAFISLLAMPLSLLAAILVLSYRGATINTMILAGLIIALGEVVDDAIIDVENIMRRLRQNASSASPRSAFQVVYDASLEVRSAVVYGSLVVVLVLMPVFFLGGLSGSFFRPLALSYILAMLASLVVALTLTPALSLLLLPPAAARQTAEPPLVAFLKAHYRRRLPVVLKKSKSGLRFMALAFLLTIACLPFLGEELLPNFQEYDFLMHWVEKPGTSLEAMTRITIRASEELRSIPGVRNFGAHIGRAEVSDEVVGPNFTELWISLDPSVDYEATVARVQAVVDGYPGLYRDLLTYLKERIKEVLTGADASIVVRIYGPELETLYETAERVAETMATVEGVADLHIEQQVLVPQVIVRPRPEAARQFGLTPGTIRQAATTLLQGARVGQIYRSGEPIDVVVWGDARYRRSVTSLRELRVDLPQGGQVPLGDVAEIHVGPTPNVINREGTSRRIDVICNARGRDLGSVARDVEAAVRSLDFPRGYHPEFLGEFVEQRRARNRLLFLSLLSVIGIFLILHADFGSLRPTLLVFLSLPFALIGSVLAVILSGGVLSLGSLVGFITVLGIAARNGVMLVSHYRHLETEEGERFGEELALRGAEERLAPILMTALTTMLAILPIVVRGNVPGQEIEHPMAVVILGGLLTSCLLNLILLPALYARFGEPFGSAGKP
ncbi:MAG: efflux RND transporter permease subunit [Vicinamibacteria bacterium]